MHFISSSRFVPSMLKSWPAVLVGSLRFGVLEFFSFIRRGQHENRVAHRFSSGWEDMTQFATNGLACNSCRRKCFQKHSINKASRHLFLRKRGVKKPNNTNNFTFAHTRFDFGSKSSLLCKDNSRRKGVREWCNRSQRGYSRKYSTVNCFPQEKKKQRCKGLAV